MKTIEELAEKEKSVKLELFQKCTELYQLMIKVNNEVSKKPSYLNEGLNAINNKEKEISKFYWENFMYLECVKKEFDDFESKWKKFVSLLMNLHDKSVLSASERVKLGLVLEDFNKSNQLLITSIKKHI